MTSEKLSSAEQGFVMILIKAFIEEKPISRKDYDDTVAITLKHLYNRLNKDGTFRYKAND